MSEGGQSQQTAATYSKGDSVKRTAMGRELNILRIPANASHVSVRLSSSRSSYK